MIASTTTAATPRVRTAPSQVHEVLKRHMLADGMPLVLDLDGSHGSWLRDSLRGRDLLDFFTSFSSYPMGYNHPKMAEEDFQRRILKTAIVKPANADLYTTQMADFVETFSRTVPEAFRQHLFFVSGGALAVENALKTAFDWKVRRNLAAGKGEKGYQVIHFRQAFHGRSGYTLSLTNTDPRKTQYFPKFSWPRVSNPKLTFPLTQQGVEETIAAEERAVAEIERAVRENPDDIAALIVEPIQGEGGDNHFRGEFLVRLRQLADEHEFLLVFDEVQTGFGTTGRWWCFEHFGMEPDIFAFGKKTQICGIAVNHRIDDVDSVFKVSSRINSTWGGNLVDMVRCQRFVEIIEEDGLLANATLMGARFVEGLLVLAESFPEVTAVRGRGLFVAFDLHDADQRKAVLAAMNAADLLALPCGERSVRFRPALVVQADEVDEGMRRTERALAAVLR